MARKEHAKSPGQVPVSVSWRERISSLRHVPSMLKLVWEAHRLYTVAMITLRLLLSFAPVALLWVAKLIIDTIVASQQGALHSRRLWNLVAIEIAIIVVRDLIARASELVENLLAELFVRHTTLRLMEHSALLDLHHFEDPDFYDQLERAHKQTNNRLGLVTRLLSMGQDFLTLVLLGGALAVYDARLLILLVVTVFPSFFGEMYFAKLEYFLARRRTSGSRQLDYIRYVSASKTTAKEVKMFRLSSWLLTRFRTLSQQFYDEIKKLATRKAAVISCFQMIGTVGYYAAYVIILDRALRGGITIGMLTFLAGSFARARDLINLQLLGASHVFTQALYLGDLFDFFKLKPSITSSSGAMAVPRSFERSIVFEDVSFRYPGSDRWAVRHVSFELRPGERIAFVGENGAGKTTLTKLLARFYDPTEGRILLDGKDIRDYDLQSFRGAIGVIFQDFVRYDWRFDENIGIGEIDDVRVYLDSQGQPGNTNGRKRHGWRRRRVVSSEPPAPAPVPPSIVSAAEKSLASTLLPRFSDGYRQMLGRRFETGVDLSGGEWQKVALARAYMRNAQVLILDEPTAALDARAEYEVFKRFSELVTGRTAVIISHRFSTVRMADRIMVFQNGSVVEQGTHHDLLARGGVYAELFGLQAEGYR